MARTSRRDLLLEAASRVAAEPGRLTLDRVAAVAGVSKGGLLYHFPDRDSLLRALVQEHVRAFEAAIEHADDAEWARRYVRQTLATAGADQRLVAVAAQDLSLLEPLHARMAAWHARAARHPGLLTVLLAADAVWYAGLLGLPAPEIDLLAELGRVLDRG